MHPSTHAPVSGAPAIRLAATLLHAESLCIKCGFCLPVCPTYRETGNEAASPRGRLDLMYAVARGHLSLRAIEPALALCLGCQACETACPSGIRYHDMLEAEREDLAVLRRADASRWLGRVALAMLTRPRVLRCSVWALWFYQRSGLQALVRLTHVLRLIPPLARLERRVPPLRRPVRWRYPLPRTAPTQGQATLLVGCIMDAAFGEVHDATAHVLSANGIALVESPGQTCCGALHLHAGEAETARDLARRNIAAFERASDALIVVNSAGCGAAMKAYGALLAGDPVWAERARRCAARVKDVAEFLDGLVLRTPGTSVPLSVAYDDPCHLLHAQKVREPPRALLARVSGLQAAPLREADMCCGSAGSYSLLQGDMSARLLARKMVHIASSGATVVATGNPGCLLQLRLGAKEHRIDIDIVHPIELLAAGYGWRAPGS